MKILKWLLLYGSILVISGLGLDVLAWPYALDTAETDTAYPVACGIILIIIIIGQLTTMIVTSVFSRCKEECEVCWGVFIFIYYPIVWFSCGAGQMIVVVLMVINAVENSDTGVKVYGGFIIALSILYAFASSVYSTVVCIWFYHKFQRS